MLIVKLLEQWAGGRVMVHSLFYPRQEGSAGLWSWLISLALKNPYPPKKTDIQKLVLTW